MKRQKASIFICLILSIYSSVNLSDTSEMPINYDLLNTYKKETSIFGGYAIPISIAYSHFIQNIKHRSIDKYLITVSETETDYVVYFRVPLKIRVLGGGAIDYIINKKTLKLTDVKIHM